MRTAILHLEDFIHEARALRKRDWRLERFWDLVRRLDLSTEALEEHVSFGADTYARNLIVLTPQFEMLALCWRPGQKTTVHDHMESFSVVKVIRGKLRNHLYQRLDDGAKAGYAEVREIRVDEVVPGDYASLDVGGIHMMENPANSGEDLVTLHFYAQPLREINIFEPKTNRLDRLRLRYALEDRI